MSLQLTTIKASANSNPWRVAVIVLPSPPVRYPVYPTGAVTRIQESLVFACIRYFPVMRLCGGVSPAPERQPAQRHPSIPGLRAPDVGISRSTAPSQTREVASSRDLAGPFGGQRIGFQLASDLPGMAW